MKTNIGNIIKKELSRFFGDKRLLFTAVIMPGLMVYIVYSLVGNLMAKSLTTDDEYVFKVVTANMPKEIEKILVESRCEVSSVGEEQLQTIQNKIIEKNTDICIIFPKDFITNIKEYDVNSGQKAPEVRMYYLSTETNSATAYKKVQDILEHVEESMSNRFDVNVSDEQFDLATESDTTGKFVSMLMPMLLMILLFNGCVAMAPDAIAGEKERGTIATLLVTPVKHYEIAIGKIVSLSIMTFLSGLSSFLGIMLSLPKLMGTTEVVKTDVYTVMDYLLLLLVVLSTVLCMISLVSIFSAFASSVKEAGTMMSPFSILIAIIGISGMYSDGTVNKMWMYLLPLYNSAQCMNEIFSFQIRLSAVITTIISNLICSIIFLIILTRMFSSEKIMFTK